MDDILVTCQKIINVPGGDVMHVMKQNEIGYEGFGEAYFSKIESGVIKAWKRHKKMTLNLIVPLGRIKFVLYDNRLIKKIKIHTYELSINNYVRLTVPPMVWIGFQGLAKHTSFLLNIADIKHDPEEMEKIYINDINYNWDKE